MADKKTFATHTYSFQHAHHHPHAQFVKVCLSSCATHAISSSIPPCQLECFLAGFTQALCDHRWLICFLRCLTPTWPFTSCLILSFPSHRSHSSAFLLCLRVGLCSASLLGGAQNWSRQLRNDKAIMADTGSDDRKVSLLVEGGEVFFDPCDLNPPASPARMSDISGLEMETEMKRFSGLDQEPEYMRSLLSDHAYEFHNPLLRCTHLTSRSSPLTYLFDAPTFPLPSRLPFPCTQEPRPPSIAKPSYLVGAGLGFNPQVCAPT